MGWKGAPALFVCPRLPLTSIRGLFILACGCPSPPSGGFSFLPELTAAQFKFKVRDLVSNSSTSKEIKNRYDPKRRG